MDRHDSQRSYTFAAPLNFSATLHYIGRFENDRMNAVVDGVYFHVLADSKEHFLVSLSSPHPQQIEAKILSGRTSIAKWKLVERFVRRTFGSCDNLSCFYKHRADDDVLNRVRKHFRGLRVVGIVSLWECLAWSIIGQQISIYAAFAVRSRLTKLAGTQLTYRDQIYEGFPSPAQFLSLSPARLRGAGFSLSKAKYLLDIAEMTVAGDLDENSLLASTKQEVRKKLLGLRGVGPWTCEYAMMRVFGDTDALPLEDIGLRNAVGREYRLGRQASMPEVAEISEAWKPFRGHATFYLWQTLAKDKR